jgi:hypothetical protein
MARNGVFGQAFKAIRRFDQHIQLAGFDLSGRL